MTNNRDDSLLQETKLNPGRYLWNNGRPVLDILRAITDVKKGDGPVENITAAFLQDLKAANKKSNFVDIASRRDNIDAKLITVKAQIEDWIQQIKARSVEQEKQDVRRMLLNGETPKFEGMLSVTTEIRELTTWISTAQNIASELESEKARLSKELSRAFGTAAQLVAEKAQREVDLLVREIEATLIGFQDAIHSMANENRFNLSGVIGQRYCGLKIYSRILLDPINTGISYNLHVS